MINLKILILSLILFNFNYVQGQDCHHLLKGIHSFNEAILRIESEKSINANLEKVDTSKSSWIRGLTYYPCGDNAGFLIMNTDKKKYIHQNVPKWLWSEFKKAKSFGSFYNNYLRNKYQVNI